MPVRLDKKPKLAVLEKIEKVGKGLGVGVEIFPQTNFFACVENEKVLRCGLITKAAKKNPWVGIAGKFIEIFREEPHNSFIITLDQYEDRDILIYTRFDKVQGELGGPNKQGQYSFVIERRTYGYFLKKSGEELEWSSNSEEGIEGSALFRPFTD